MFKRILIYLYVNFMGAIKIAKEQIFDRQRELNEKDLPDQTGRHIVITGGNRGIGLEAVKTFLAAGAHVIIGCRRPSNLEAALLKCRTAGLTGGSYKCVELDLMSMKSVRKFAEVIISKNIPIHVLVNNAGIMFGPRKETINGFESQMATNYLGHFLLTSLLFPQLRRAGRPDNFSRIVNVSSVAHFSGSWMNFDDLQSKSTYIPEQAYGNSKAAQVLMTFYLDNMLKSEDNCYIKVNCIHPGMVKTDLYTHVGWVKALDKVSDLLMKTVEQGGDTVVHAAISAEIEGRGGLYLENFYPARNSSFTSDQSNQKKLFDLSCKILDIDIFGKA